MSSSNKPGGKGALLFLAGIVGAVGIAFLGVRDHRFQQNVSDAGYTNVSAVYTSFRTAEVTTTLHGCKIGFQSQKGASRTVNGHAVTPYTISLIGSDNKWTSIQFTGNAAPAPTDVAAYLKQHKPPCYQP